MAKVRGRMAKDSSSTERALVLHAFSNLSQISPPVFVDILKHTYLQGNGKAIIKFQALRQQVMNALEGAPPPGPATYVVHCLNALLLVDSPYSEALSHLLTSALTYLDKVHKPFDDAAEARKVASQLFHSVITGSVTLEERILVKLATVFGIQLRDLGEAESCLEPFIVRLIKSRLYSSAVALLKHFSLQHSTPEEFLVAMICDNQVEAAEQWAVYMGRHMICSLVQHCIEFSLFKKAYKIVQKYSLQLEFPDAYHQYRKSSLRKLVEKGCWDIAESIANEDCKFVEYLVDLARDLGDAAKAADICHRHCLPYFPFCSVQEGIVTEIQYLQLADFVSEENVIWVDTHDGLADVARHILDIKIVGIDCEWRPNCIKRENMSKVSILQIATGKKVFIFDLIKLVQERWEALDNCLKLIFHSPNILKLGYALHNDLEQLLRSYGGLMCFHYCESTLDLQSVFPFSKGGLSGLTKTILGGHLNKTPRMTDWEQRPLSHSQLHYAALDAAVLISIFDTLSHEPTTLEGVLDLDISDWHLHIKCFRSKLSRKKHCAALDHNAQSASSTVKESDTNLISSRVLCEQKDNPPGSDLKLKAVVASGSDTNITCSSDIACVEEELVYASCELLGLPIPGLLKSELQFYAHAAKLPHPIYDVSHKLGAGNRILYYCSVTIGGMKFYGHLAASKKEAETWAAVHALSHLLEGFFPHIHQSCLGTFYDHCFGLPLMQEALHIPTDIDPNMDEDDLDGFELQVVPSSEHITHSQKTWKRFSTSFSLCKCYMETSHDLPCAIHKTVNRHAMHLTREGVCMPWSLNVARTTFFPVTMHLQYISRKVPTAFVGSLPLHGHVPRKTLQRIRSEVGRHYYHASHIKYFIGDFRIISTSMSKHLRSFLC